MKHNSLNRTISTVAINMSGDVDHSSNMLLLSDRLEELGTI